MLVNFFGSSRFPRLVLAVITLLVLGGVLVFRPFWGLMDDASHVFSLVPALEKEGILAGAWHYARNDLGWGMFRPTYPLMVYPLYKPGMLGGPVVTFFLNALFALAAAAGVVHVLAKILPVRRDWALVALAAFFYEYDLLQHPSLQEKLILLFGASLLRLAWGPTVVNRFVHALLFVLVFLLGVGAKASFMIYVSMALWAYFSRRRGSLFARGALMAWVKLALFAFLAAGALVSFAVIAKNGQYTHQFDLAKAPGNLASPAGVMFLLPLALFLAQTAWDPREVWRQPERLTAFLGVLAFLAIFLPWGIQAYVQSVIGPVYVCLCLQVADGLFKRVPRLAWELPLALLALATAAYRVPTMFLRLHDIGRAVASAGEWEKSGVTEIFMPCAEGAESMQWYLREMGHSSIQVRRFAGVANGQAVFYDLALCPLPGRARAIPGCEAQENLFTGSLEKSFRLSRGRGCR